MDRRLAALLTVMLVTPVLAGCLGGDSPTMTARAGVEDARDAARERLDDPQLTQVMGLEPFRHVVEDEGREEIWLHLDADNTDGEAPGWGYLFRDGDTTYGVVLYANGKVLGEIRERPDEDRGSDQAEDPVLEGWEVDSDEVARTLADHDDWPAPTENTTVNWNLQMREGEPVWRVGRSDDLFGGDVTALVHAGNGTVLAIHDGRDGERPVDGPGGGTMYEEETQSGTVSPAQDVAASIETDGPGRVDALLEAGESDLGPAAGSLTFQLLRDGEVVDEETIDDPDGGTWNLSLEPAPADTYTARVTTDEDVRDVRVTLRGLWST